MLDETIRLQRLTGDLRSDLRTGTAAAHRRLDLVVEAMDVASRAGLGRFLRASDVSLSMLRNRLEVPGLPSTDCLRVHIAEDMNALGIAPAPKPTRLPGGRDAERLGAYYVVAGSRLGAQVLARRQGESRDPVVRTAGHYLNAPEGLGIWRAFLYRCVEVNPISEPDTRAILAGAHAAFDVFQRAFADEGRREDPDD